MSAPLWEVVVSASVPRFVQGRDPKFAQNVPPDVAFEINEAVVNLTAAVLSSRGRLVFGGHPSITPLVAQTVLDYFNVASKPIPWEELRLEDLVAEAEEGRLGAATYGDSLAESLPRLPKEERPIVVYQSRIFADLFVDELEVLLETGVAEVVLTPVMENGRARDEVPLKELPSLRKRRDVLDASLTKMRNEMLERPNLVGMFAVGGLEGVLNEAKDFETRHPGKPIYAMAGTGGAARYLSQASHGRGVRVVDQSYLRRVAARVDAHDLEIPPTDLVAEADGTSPPPLTPYSLIMTLLVRELRGE